MGSIGLEERENVNQLEATEEGEAGPHFAPHYLVYLIDIGRSRMECADSDEVMGRIITMLSTISGWKLHKIPYAL